MKIEKIICAYCDKKLIPFKTTSDWISRKYHKVCWQKKYDDFIRQEQMAFFLKAHPQS
jgi:hypothetical protein